MLKIALKVLEPLENLNRSLQSQSSTVGGMLAATQVVKLHLQELRTTEVFSEIFKDTNNEVSKLDLDPLQLPRERRVPAR